MIRTRDEIARQESELEICFSLRVYKLREARAFVCRPKRNVRRRLRVTERQIEKDRELST